MSFELEVLKQFTDYGVMGAISIILMITVFKLATKIDTRNAEDRQILSSLGKKLEQSNLINIDLTREIKLTREFFKSTIEHERSVSKVCFSELSNNQKSMQELLIKINASQNSLHKRVDKVLT